MYYRVEEDTLLLLDNISPRGKILEVGAGSGYISLELAKRGFDVTATDIDEDAISHMEYVSKMEKLNIRIVKSDLFENIEGEFDTIIFNPPYLPGDITQDIAIYGGMMGQEIVERFLEQAYDHLSKNGTIYVIFSSYNDIEKLRKKFYFYSFKEIARKNFFFHSIYVYRLEKK
ncbi:MAG: methyltransferase [Thermoplasmata archaeon]|nr:methyltransferase [Thermoplasmata archaeon]